MEVNLYYSAGTKFELVCFLGPRDYYHCVVWTVLHWIHCVSVTKSHSVRSVTRMLVDSQWGEMGELSFLEDRTQ